MNVQVAADAFADGTLLLRFVQHRAHAKDSEGQLFSSPENARKEALRILQDVARDEMPNSDNLKITIKMRTDKRGQIFEASLTVKSAWS
ncbi:hypothetical protein [Mesorhizobium sp.]|uniref:DUF6894 family protein n=1 Tax=Mesorhizobium sp. TaxID=1871066 RepID=UPI0025C5E8A7|nr:hypothetical protein [Mesorhizobium sp.]